MTITPSELVAGRIYFLWNYADDKLDAIEVETIQFTGTDSSHGGEIVKYVFIFPGATYQRRLREKLEAQGIDCSGMGLAQPQLLMDENGLNDVVTVHGLIELLQQHAKLPRYG